MKVLITYYSGTGNTKKVAEAIKTGISQHEVELKPVNEVEPASLNSYDLVFLGSGIYAFNVSRRITKLVKKAQTLPSKVAYFYTHESIDFWPDAFKSVNKIIENTNCELLGEFDCCGENLVELAEEQRQAKWSTMSPEEKQKAEEIFLNHVKGHPNEEDLKNAKKFAESILEKV